MIASLWRAAPCPVMTSGRLCGRTDERPLVLDAANLHGWICLSHRPSLAPKPKAEA
ncbi:MAG: hypothetical protein ACREMZ_15695 [Gemmatimonadales bacterium]